MTNPNIASTPIADFLSNLRLAPRQAYKSLTLWPLRREVAAGAARTTPYVTLGTALRAGTLLVDEVSKDGSVPNVRITNQGDDAVLFLFGEEIRGAKQNRIANATFLVSAKREVVIDVSCVEVGRWSRRRGALFREADEVVSSALRRRMASNVNASRARGGSFDADQGMVWSEISERMQLSGTLSETEAYADYRESRTPDLESLSDAFRPIDGQVGFVACIGDAVVGLEAIGRPEVFRDDFQALLRSYAIDAVDSALIREIEKAPLDAPRFEDPEAFIAAVTRAGVTRGPSLGAGDDLRFENPEVAGCALDYDGLVSLTAFPA